jgi:ubiquinol-cytochrome c reductase cytochrome b subunit
MRRVPLLRRLDERLGFASTARTALAKIFPDHWSFMLGEIALYSFLLLVTTGVYLTLFFEPSTATVVYEGEYEPLRGELVSGALASTVELSWDVRGGLLIRQAHHWAAHIFIGAIVLHLCRIFFTGMFRKPRELNWIVGVTLLLLAIFNGFTGYSLPDDLLSGTGLHIFNSIALAVPFAGAWLAFLVFGGEFPGDVIIERLYPLHILLVPALIAVLITVHLAILVRQKHSHFAGPGRRSSNVVGSRVWPAYALRSLSLLFAVAAATFLAGGLVQINPVWVWAEFYPQSIMSPSVADWYILWIEGALRLFPPVEFRIFGFLVPNQFWAGVFLPGLTFALLYLWPLIDRWITGDRATHHLTGRPRDCPIRVAIGVTALTFYGMLLVAGAQELIVLWTGASLEVVRQVLRVLVLALPPIAGGLAYWLAAALLRSGKEELLELGPGDLTRRSNDEDASVGASEGSSTAESERR